MKDEGKKGSLLFAVMGAKPKKRMPEESDDSEETEEDPEEEEADAEDEEPSEALRASARDLIAAIRSEDEDEVARALKSAHDNCM